MFRRLTVLALALAVTVAAEASSGTKMVTQVTPRTVLRMARKYVDVLTVDDYTLLPSLDDAIQETFGPFVPRTPSLAEFHDISRRPVTVKYSWSG